MENLTTSTPSQEFPIDCLPDFVRDYIVNAVSPTNTKHQWDIAGTVILGVLASCLQKKFVVEIQDNNWYEPLNLYMAVLTGHDEELEYNIIQKMAYVLRSYEQKCKIGQISSSAGSKAVPIVGCGDSSYPSNKLCLPIELVNSINSNEGGFTVIPFQREQRLLKSLFGSDSFNNYQLRLVWKRCYLGEKTTVFSNPHSVKEHKTENEPALSAVLAVNLHDDMKKIFSIDNGESLLSRFLFSCDNANIDTDADNENESPVLEPEAAEESRLNYEKAIYRLLKISSLPDCNLLNSYNNDDKKKDRIVTFSSEAKKLLNSYYDRIGKYEDKENRLYSWKTNTNIYPWLARQVGKTSRIAAIICISEIKSNESNYVINTQTLERAIRIGDYFQTNAEYFYAQFGTV